MSQYCVFVLPYFFVCIDESLVCRFVLLLNLPRFFFKQRLTFYEIKKDSDHLPVTMTVAFPDTYTFHNTGRRQHRKEATAAYFEMYTHTAVRSSTVAIDPLRYKGAHGRSTVTRTDKELNEEFEPLLNIITEMNQITDEQLCHQDRTAPTSRRNTETTPTIDIGFHTYRRTSDCQKIQTQARLR